MKKLNLNSKGFAPLVAVLAAVVLVVVVGGGAYVYHKNHKAKTVSDSTSTGSTSKTSKTSTSTKTATTTDPYAGWQSQCDTTYHYCFKYPSGWTSDNGELVSPSKTVRVNYQNPDNRDGGLISFTPSYVQKLTSANEDLTAVGGYYAVNSQPIYAIVDSSLLSANNLTVGTTGQFVNNPIFTDTGASTATSGAFTAIPNVSINTVADAQAWLNGSEAKTGLQILQSFSSQQ